MGVKLTTRLPSSAEDITLFPHTPTRRGDKLIKLRDNFTFFLLCYKDFCTNVDNIMPANGGQTQGTIILCAIHISLRIMVLRHNETKSQEHYRIVAL
jgi:hypothetical protein